MEYGTHQEPLVGPRAHERTRERKPEDSRLADGSPLYHALLQNPDAPVADKDDVRAARAELAQYISEDPERVLRCEGKTASEAARILRSENKGEMSDAA